MALTEADKIRKAEEIYYRRNGIKLEEKEEKKRGNLFVGFLRKIFLLL